MIRFYGQAKVLQVLINEIKFLSDSAIVDVCIYFPLPWKNFYTKYGNSRDKDIDPD